MAELDTQRLAGNVPREQGQLTLPVELADSATFDNFLSHGNTGSVLATLRQQCGSEHTAEGASPEQVVYLHGVAGSGKTHLLQAVAHADSQGCLYLPLAELHEFDPAAVLQQAEFSRRLCIDDLQYVAGQAHWEQALFDFYNRARAAGCFLLFSADVSPRALALSLEDLRSRLSWGIVYALEEPDDVAKAELLALRGSARGMTLSPAVASYIVTRASRETGQLLAVLDLLSEASLVRKRPISIPFVKEVLGF